MHTLKTWEPYFSATLRGEKTFEVRKNDRNYAVGDIIKHVQCHPCPACNGRGTQRVFPGGGGPAYKIECSRCKGNPLTPGEHAPIYTEVGYILRGGRFGMGKDYCAMSVRKVTLMWRKKPDGALVLEVLPGDYDVESAPTDLVPYDKPVAALEQPDLFPHVPHA